MMYIAKWLLVCVATVILVWSETDAYPSVWKRDVTLIEHTVVGNALHQDPSVSGVCDSQICHEDAAEFLDSMDNSVDPCDDFYQFTCGGWREKHPPTNETRSRRSLRSLLSLSRDGVLMENLQALVKSTLEEPISEDDISPFKAAKKMYQVCMDIETIERAGIQPLVDLSNELGGWPMALEHWNEDSFSLESTLADFERHMAWQPLFHTISFFDINDTNRRSVQIAENTGDLPTFDLLDPEFEEKRAELELMIANATFHIMNATGVITDEDSVLLQARQIFEFMMQLKYLTSKNESTEMFTLNKLQEWTDSALVVNAHAQFNWLSYLNKILSNTDIVLDDNEQVVVLDMDYWIRLFQLLDNTPRRVIANYLQWSFIDSYKRKTEMWMRDRITHDERLSRSKHCLEVTKERFNHAINSRLVPNIYDEDDKRHFNVLVENLRSELIDTVSNITWLDEDSRAVVLERVQTMKAYSGYPDIYNNASALLDYYKQVNVSDVHFTNMLIDSSEDYERSLPFLRQPVYEDHLLWDYSPELPFAIYNSDLNYLMISFGHLQTFYFKVGRLEAVHYGRLGAIVGHEMMHGITTTYGEEWNSNTSQLFYNDQCFIDQYEKYHIPELEEARGRNVTVNGTSTLQENIGDIYGMHTAYAAYQTYVQRHGTEQSLPGLEEYSPDQLFYISYGMAWCELRTEKNMVKFFDDEHSPPYARVRGTVSTSDDFARAFNCPTGSNMNPVDKCRLW